MSTNDEIRAHLAASIEQVAERTRKIPEIPVTELVALRAENARLRALLSEAEFYVESRLLIKEIRAVLGNETD